jgi:hypothetical protein
MLWQKIESSKVICSMHWYLNVCYVGPMVAEIDKKCFWHREVQLREYITENQRRESH